MVGLPLSQTRSLVPIGQCALDIVLGPYRTLSAAS